MAVVRTGKRRTMRSDAAGSSLSGEASAVFFCRREEARPPMSGTSVALSNLRAFAILMVGVFHSFIAYLGCQPDSPVPFDSPPYSWTANPIVDSARWFG